MTLTSFINKYIGKRVDFDGAYGAQCVDLFRQYCKDVLEIPHTGSVAGAKDLWLNYPNMPLERKYFVCHTDRPQIGDVVVFNGTKTNMYGHVGIVVAVRDDTLLIFDQDGFKQDGAKLSLRLKNYVLGYLRPKDQVAL